MESLFVEVLDRVKHGLRSVMLFICVGALWTLRNDVVFNIKVLAFPMVVIHKTIMLIISWQSLLKMKTLAMAETLLRRFSRACVKCVGGLLSLLCVYPLFSWLGGLVVGSGCVVWLDRCW